MLTRHLTKSLVRKLTRSLIDFDPSGFSGLELWLDVTDNTTVTKDEANATSKVIDRRINGIEATQGIETARPLYTANGIGGLPSLTFDGTADWLAANGAASTFNNDFTLFLVLKPAAALSQTVEVVAAQISSGTGGSGVKCAGIQTDGDIQTVVGGSPILLDSNDWRGTPLIYETTVDYGTATQATKLNGVQNTEGDITIVQPNTMDLFSIGQEFDGVPLSTASNFYKGDISEILIYSRSLSTPERSAINAYLGNKYSISVTDNSYQFQDGGYYEFQDGTQFNFN